MTRTSTSTTQTDTSLGTSHVAATWLPHGNTSRTSHAKAQGRFGSACVARSLDLCMWGRRGVCIRRGNERGEREHATCLCACRVHGRVDIVRPSSPSARAVCLFVTAPTGGSPPRPCINQSAHQKRRRKASSDFKSSEVCVPACQSPYLVPASSFITAQRLPQPTNISVDPPTSQ